MPQSVFHVDREQQSAERRTDCHDQLDDPDIARLPGSPAGLAPRDHVARSEGRGPPNQWQATIRGIHASASEASATGLTPATPNYGRCTRAPADCSARGPTGRRRRRHRLAARSPPPTQPPQMRQHREQPSVTMATHGAGERREKQPVGMKQRGEADGADHGQHRYFVISASAPARPSQSPARRLRPSKRSK